MTYNRAYESTLFVQDEGLGLFVNLPNSKLVPGDRVQIEGKTAGSFNPVVAASSATVLGHSPLPPPVPATFDELSRSKYDCELVKVRGVVRAANRVPRIANRVPHEVVFSIHLEVISDDGKITVFLDSDDLNISDQLLDSEVEFTGVAGGTFDGKMEMTGILLHVSSLEDIKILKHPETSPWSLPVIPMGTIFSSNRVKDQTQRAHIRGTVTFFQPGSFAVLQLGGTSLQVMTNQKTPLRIGYLADAIGFASVQNGFLALIDGEVQQTPIYAPIVPIPVTHRQLTASRNLFDLVTIQGQVVMQNQESSQDEYVLLSDGYKFSAIIRHPPSVDTPMLPIKEVPLGSTVSVTGICILEGSNPYWGDVPFNILMRGPDDITVVTRPSVVNLRNLMLLTGALLLVVIVVGGWGWTLKRKVLRQTSTLSTIARFEQRRSSILEQINSAAPLPEILQQITDAVSSRLHCAACWCELADGTRLGNPPPQEHNLRIVRKQIFMHGGAQLGGILGGFDPDSRPTAEESDSLIEGARIAALAIDTRQHRSELRHRLEFDLLTDIHNRFSLERNLADLVDEARHNERSFGLIYIDLDKFKPINDRYGHHIGDLYLQEVALRMMRQMRGNDMLARIGGDEFAALIPQVRARADLDDIAQRLEHCFDLPFAIEGYMLRGAASIGIAVFPEDGDTKDKLLHSADVNMYAIKNSKHQNEMGLDGTTSSVNTA